MTLHAALTPIEDCTAPFRVGAELEVSLWLSAVHVYDPYNVVFDSRGYVDPGLSPTIHQAVANAARPNLTLLRSRAVRVELVHKMGEYGEVLDYGRSRVWVSEPLSVGIGFRRLQQGPWSVPKEEQPFAALGFLNTSAHPGDRPARVRVDAVLALDLEPLSPTFGAWWTSRTWGRRR